MSTVIFSKALCQSGIQMSPITHSGQSNPTYSFNSPPSYPLSNSILRLPISTLTISRAEQIGSTTDHLSNPPTEGQGVMMKNSQLHNLQIPQKDNLNQVHFNSYFKIKKSVTGTDIRTHDLSTCALLPGHDCYTLLGIVLLMLLSMINLVRGS